VGQVGEWVAQDSLDSQVVELAGELVTQPLVVRTGQDLVGQVDQHDVFFRPHGGDLTGEFQPDRTGAEQHDPVCAGEVGVRDAVAADRVDGVRLVAIGREGVGRAGRKDDEIGGQFLPGCQDDPVGRDVRGTVAHDRAVFEQVVVWQEDSGLPGRLDQGPHRGNVVHERVFGFHERDVGAVVNRTGDVDAGIAAADDHDGRSL